jgi:hypothetical protein
MAVNTRNKQDTNYLNYLTRVINDEGTYEKVPLYQYVDQYNKLLAYNPTLLLYPSSKKNGTLYSVLPNNSSSNFTFTRASSGSFIDSNGNLQIVGNDEPRLVYSDFSKQYKGMLVESPSTNLLLRSEEFDNGYWTIYGLLNERLANQTLAPNNTLTADLLGFNGVDLNLLRRTSIPISSSTGYAISLFVKNNTFTQNAGTITVTLNNNIIAPNNFTIGSTINFVNETIQVQSSGIQITGITGSASGSLTKLSNGWYRIGVSAITGISASSAVGSFEIGTTNQSGSCFIWGAQLESSRFLTPVTSYIPTSATTITRIVDNPTLPNLNLGVTSWSIFFEIEYDGDYIAQSGDVNGFTGPNYIWYFRRFNNQQVNFWNQKNQQNLGSFGYTANTIKKFRGIMTYDDTNNFINTYINGARCGTNITPTVIQPYRDFLNNSGSSITFRKVGLSGGIDSSTFIKNLAIYNYVLDSQSSQFLTQI